MLSKTDLIEEGKKYGVGDITDEEYETNKKYAVAVALHRIQNMRKGVHKKHDREIWTGILLGGRDFVYKGITVDKAKSQFLSILRKIQDENGVEFKLVEASQWGHLPSGVSHGDGCEVSIESSESTLSDGSVRQNKTARTIIVKMEKAIRTYDDIVKSGIRIHAPEDLDEDYLYNIIAVEGEIGNVDAMPIWGKGGDDTAVREGDQPIWLNEQPCLQFSLKTEGTNRVRLNLAPTNFAKLFLSWPNDFLEICKTLDIQEALATFVGLKVLAVGCVRRCKPTNDGVHIDVDATAIFFPTDLLSPADQQISEPASPAGQQTVTAAPAPPEEKKPAKKGKKKEEKPEPKAATPPETPKEPPKAAAPITAPAAKTATTIQGYKDAVSELMATLGTDNITVDDVKNAHVLPETLSEALVAAVLKKVQEERKGGK